MKYRVLASLSAVGALALGGGVAEAHNTTFQTSVEFQEVYVVNGQLGLAGQVSSARAQCVPNRTVKVFAIFENGSRELLDIARTSDNGAFAGVGRPSDEIDDALAKVRRKNIGGSGHRHICGKASANFSNGTNP
jgi:hypothetical protein